MQGFDLDGRISQPEEGILNIDVLMVSNMNFFNCKTMPQSNVFTKRKNNFLVLALWDTLRFSPFVYDKRGKTIWFGIKKKSTCLPSVKDVNLFVLFLNTLPIQQRLGSVVLDNHSECIKKFPDLICFLWSSASSIHLDSLLPFERVHKILIFQAFFLWELRWCLKKVKRLGWFSYLHDTFFKSPKPLRKFSIYLHSAKVHSAS